MSITWTSAARGPAMLGDGLGVREVAVPVGVGSDTPLGVGDEVAAVVELAPGRSPRQALSDTTASAARSAGRSRRTGGT
jgi:hypothetical protein